MSNAVIPGSNTLTRFLTHHNHFKRESQHVTERAFLPDSKLELSVFQIDGLDDNSIWALCTRRPFYGRGDIGSFVPIRIGLQILPDSGKHANILGWPADKHEQKILALQLAAEATLHLLPES